MQQFYPEKLANMLRQPKISGGAAHRVLFTRAPAMREHGACFIEKGGFGSFKRQSDTKYIVMEYHVSKPYTVPLSGRIAKLAASG